MSRMLKVGRESLHSACGTRGSGSNGFEGGSPGTVSTTVGISAKASSSGPSRRRSSSVYLSLHERMSCSPSPSTSYITGAGPCLGNDGYVIPATVTGGGAGSWPISKLATEKPLLGKGSKLPSPIERLTESCSYPQTTSSLPS